LGYGRVEIPMDSQFNNNESFMMSIYIFGMWFSGIILGSIATGIYVIFGIKESDGYIVGILLFYGIFIFSIITQIPGRVLGLYTRKQIIVVFLGGWGMLRSTYLAFNWYIGG
jgi:hypothetical protein